MASAQLFATGSPICSAGLWAPGPPPASPPPGFLGRGAGCAGGGGCPALAQGGSEDGVGQAVGRRPKLHMGFAVLHRWNL